MREGILLPTANDLLVQSYINMTNQFPITVLFTLQEFAKNNTLDNPNLLAQFFKGMDVSAADQADKLQELKGLIESKDLKKIYTTPNTPYGPYAE